MIYGIASLSLIAISFLICRLVNKGIALGNIYIFWTIGIIGGFLSGMSFILWLIFPAEFSIL